MTKNELIMQIAPWWIANGWDHTYLYDLSYKQLMGILRRAAKQGFEVKPKRHPEQLQFKF